MTGAKLAQGIGAVAGLATIVLGALVLVGWRLQLDEMVRLYAQAMPILPDVAAAFVFCGIGTLGLALDKRRWVIAGGILALILAVESALERAAGLDTDIDGMLVELLLGAAAADRTGMPGFAAGLFATAGGALLGATLRLPAQLKFVVTAIPGAVLFGLSSVVQVAFLADLTGVDLPIWGELAHKAFNPSLGHSLIGASLLLFGWSACHREREPLPHWSAWLSGLAVAAVAILLWHTLHQRELVGTERALQTELTSLKEAFIERIVSRIGPVMRIKSRWEREGGVPEEAWVSMALDAMRDHKGFTSIVWIDSDYRLRRIQPRAERFALHPLGIPVSSFTTRALDEARRDGALILSDPLHMTGRDLEFLMLTPVFVDTRFEGFIGASFAYKPLFDGLVEEQAKQGIAVSFRHGANEVLKSAGANLTAGAGNVVELSVPLFGQMLTVAVATMPSAASTEFILPEIVLALGMLFAVLLIVVVNTAVRARAGLADSERQYRDTFENAPVAVAWVSSDGRFAKTNQAFSELMGYSNAELATLGPQELVHPSEHAKTAEVMRRLFSGESDSIADEFKCVRKDGKILWVHVASAAMQRQADQSRYILAHLQDITARKLAEEQLFQSQKMEALGNLAGGIAHDFNNMLLPIIALTEMSREDLPKDSPLQENLENVLEAANQASQLVQRILTFSRHNDREMTEVDISQCGMEALTLLRNILPSSITVRDEIAPDVGHVVADHAQLQSVIMNLGTNAMDAMAGKAGVLRVSLSRVNASSDLAARLPELCEGRAYAKLSVADSGCGIDEATRKKIFNPFFTTKPVGEGTGLGLAMVHGIVDGFEGAIEVTSEVGVGTTFDIYLPLNEKESPGEAGMPADVPADTLDAA